MGSPWTSQMVTTLLRIYTSHFFMHGGGVLQVMVTHSDQALANAVWCVTSGEDPGRSERLVLETLASIPDPSQT